MIYYLRFFYFYCLNISCFDYMRNFWNGRLDEIYFESFNENDFYYKLSNYFCLSLILNNCFDFGCYDCLLFYIYFVRNFATFFDLEIFRDTYFEKVIVVYNYYSYLGVVCLNYFYCDCFFWQTLVFFQVLIKIFTSFCGFYVYVVCSHYLVVFVYIQRSMAIITPFIE